MNEFRLSLDEAIVRPGDLQRLSEKSSGFPPTDDPVVFQLIVNATVEIAEIDPAWLGYLFLLKRKHPGILITLKLPFNYEFAEGSEAIRKLRQYVVYSIIFLGNPPLVIEVADGKLDFPTKSFHENSFILSNRFGVPIFIDEREPERFKEFFFVSPMGFAQSLIPGEDPEIKWDAKTETFLKNINGLYRSRSTPGNLDECIHNLGRIAFIRILNMTWALTVYFDPARLKDSTKISPTCRAGNLGSAKKIGEINALEYFNKIEPVLLELRTKPLIYLFIFNVLITDEILPTNLEKSNAEEFASVLRKRWAFCLDLVHGLTELAKNIKEHSSTGFGVITSRVATTKFSGDKDYNWYDEFLDQLPKKSQGTSPGSILEIQVMDLGNTGVMAKLLKNLTDAINDPVTPEIIRKIYEEDITRINNGKVSLNNLLSVNKESPLNHQSKRAVAHLGLLIFSNLIEHNGGNLILISRSKLNEPEYAISPKNQPVNYPLLTQGTIFRFLLPVNEGAIYDTNLPHGSDFPAETTAEQVIGLEALMNFNVVSVNSEFKAIDFTNKKILFTHKPTADSPESHSDEMNWWLTLEKDLAKIKPMLGDPQNRIVHLDLINLRSDASRLFRIIGLWEIFYSKVPLLLSNVEQYQLEKLEEINDYYYKQNPTISYWNKYAPVIIYSYLKDIRKDMQNKDRFFYFADAMWGETPDDFILINKVIQGYHFNSVTWRRRLLKKLVPTFDPHKDQMTGHPSIFYRRQYLLPFDLLLELDSGYNLFETNTSYLLQNDIQPCLPDDEPASS